MDPNAQQPISNPNYSTAMPGFSQTLDTAGRPLQTAPTIPQPAELLTATPEPQPTNADGTPIPAPLDPALIGMPAATAGETTIATALGIDVQRLDAFKKNLTYLWEESIALTGLPLEHLLTQVFTNAANLELPATGAMAVVGKGQASFLPTRTTLDLWVNSYFNRVVPTGADMAEA